MFKRICSNIVTVTAFVLLCAVGNAQNTNSGDIRGTVTDSTGGVVSKVTVTVKDVDKGVVSVYTTDDAGVYDTGSVVPDHYLLTFTREGFQTFVRGPITLQVATVDVNAQLSIGALQQVVVVNADIPLLTTESGAQTTTLESASLLKLPQVGADWQSFISLMPGAAPGYSGGSASGTSINGNLPFNSVLADGATTTLPMSENSDVMVLETVSEVKIDTSAFSAQYGIGGAIFNQVSKGGSNQFHGSAYEFFQNDALNAAPYNFGQVATVPILRYNNFGGSVSGPVIKNKMFFYFNYDRTINHGGASSGFATVPTDAMRAGDFRGLPTIYDPSTQTVDGSGIVHRISFADEYGQGNVIPTSMLDPVAKNIQAFYPKANTPGTQKNDGSVVNNFFFNTPSSNPFIKWFGRLDYNLNDKNHVVISETSSDNPATYLNQGTCPVNCQNGDVSRDNAQVSDVWSISSRTINEARLGFTDQLNYFTPYSINKGYPAKLGWQFSKADVFPDVQVQGNCCYGLTPSSNSVYKEMAFDPSDVLTMTRGRHILSFGGEFLINRADSTAWGNINGGSVSFAGDYTASSQGTKDVSGVAYADFLLGYSNSWNANVSPEYGGRLKNPQGFIQDEYKIRQNLTLTAGLRYQGLTGWHEVKGNIRSFDPTVMNPATHTLGAEWYAITHANGRTSLEKPIWDTFLPRFGFSYGYRPQTVIRGGIGLYAYTFSNDAYGQGMGSALSSSGGESDNTNGVLPVVLLGSDGSTNYQGAAGKSINSLYVTAPLAPDAYNGQGVNYTAYNTPAPKILQWNLAVQQELNSNTIVEAAYVASHGFDLLFGADLNQVPQSKLAVNDASGPTNARPYPQFQGIGGGNSGGTNNTISNYSALQVTMRRRLSSGLTANVNYTWSKMLDSYDSSGGGGGPGNMVYQNAYDPGANYGASNFDTRHMFKDGVTYELPFGHGRQFLNNNAFVDELIGGWQIAHTMVWASGSPFTPVMANNVSYAQAGSQYPNVVGKAKLRNRTINQWFNVDAYQSPGPAAFGNGHRNDVYGPQYLLTNLALGKSFQIWEKVSFEVRGEALNFINHPSFGLPDNGIGPGHSGQISGISVGGRTMQFYGRLSF